MRKRIIPLAAAACVAAAIVFVAWLLVGPSSPAVQSAYAQLKEVVENSKSVHWAHMRVRPGAPGTTSDVTESWMGFQPRRYCYREGEQLDYWDLPAGRRWRYDRKKNTITITADSSMTSLAPNASNFFEETTGTLDELAKRGATIEQGQLVENGTSFTMFTVTFPDQSGQIRVLVDPLAKRVVKVDQMTKGQAGQWTMAISLEIDYPATGPDDIYALGAPRDAQIVDLVPASAVTDLIEKVIANRRAFAETYFACVYRESLGDDYTEVYGDLVWKKAGQYRFERVNTILGGAKRTAAPTDMTAAEEWIKTRPIHFITFIAPDAPVRGRDPGTSHEIMDIDGQLKREDGSYFHSTDYPFNTKLPDFMFWPDLNVNHAHYTLVPPAPGDAPGLITLQYIVPGSPEHRGSYPIRIRMTFDPAHDYMLVRYELIWDPQADWIENKSAWSNVVANDPEAAAFYLRNVETVEEFAVTAAGKKYAHTFSMTSSRKRDRSDEHASGRLHVFVDTARPVADELLNRDSVTVESFRSPDRPTTQPTSSPAATTAPGR